jgi:hypothetical protein
VRGTLVNGGERLEALIDAQDLPGPGSTLWLQAQASRLHPFGEGGVRV